MSEGAKNKDNPEEPGAGEKGLGSETGGLSGPGGPEDVTRMAPERRGEVRYPDVEDPDGLRSDATPQEGGVDEDPDTAKDSATE
jgi:hypothetical protein